MANAAHWDSRYESIGFDQVSWYQENPETSLRLIEQTISAPADTAIVDIGGGASRLVDCLVNDGYRDVTVVDIIATALHESAARLAGADVDKVTGEVTVHWVRADIREWTPEQSFGVWHDRAVFHFLTDPADQTRYWELVRGHLVPGGHVIVATFAPDGPTTCSGLPVARYGVDDLQASMGDAFELVCAEREVHQTPTGAEQPFTWVVATRR